ncbi:MAG TPA: phosphoribosylanthranilate isomerase [Gemmatimonadaceae bacterium]|nr:phosphoribosylanthranilate isomerase [Gemmatimonadaceae bacterium]
MLARIKFCGLTRAEDAALATELGAAYAGVIFADSQRRLTPAIAQNVLAGAGETVKRVGVFGTNSPDEIAKITNAVELDVVQLHADPTPADVAAVRERFPGHVWAAVRVGDAHIPDETQILLETADAIVLDARSQHVLGGTGRPLPWSDMAADLARMRGGVSVVLAGGLTAANVETAIRTLAPDVVDVSSGVESSPGIKDRDRMEAFAKAVAGTPRRRNAG